LLCFVLVRGFVVRSLFGGGACCGFIRVGGFVVFSWRSVLIFRSISDAIMLLSAIANRLALCRFTLVPQNGQVRDFWSADASNNPLH
jgi:hypothetical protein